MDIEIQRPGMTVKLKPMPLENGGIHGQYDWFNLMASVGKFVPCSNWLPLTILNYL